MSALVELGVAQVAVWWIAVAVLASAWWVTFGGQHRNPSHDRELAWWLWHWFTGGPLETTQAYPAGGGRPRRIALRSGQAAARVTLAAGFIAAIYVRSGATHGTGIWTVSTWGVAGAVILAAVTVLVAKVAVQWSLWRHYVQPLHWAVADAAGWHLDMRWWQVRRYIRVRPGLATHLEGVVIVCGPTFKVGTDAEKNVIKIVTAKLGLGDVSVGWKREGIHRYVQFLAQEPVPEKVPFRKPEVRELIEKESTAGKVLLGFTRGGQPVWLDLDRVAPHVLMSAGTGGGKTAALVAIIAQLMWHGADVVVLDFKRISHLWLRDLAGVRYARSIEEIHDTAVWLGGEVDRRTKAWDPVTFEQREAGQGPSFPRLVVVCEEMSSTMDYLREHWNDVKERGASPRSPAVKGLAKVLNMGREVQMNTLTVAQRAEANAVGNGAMRENYPCKMLIDRYSKQTWNILAPECEYRPGISHAGRAQVCIGADATETQLLWMTQQEAQRWVVDKRGMQPRQQPADAAVEAVAHPADVPSPGEMVRDCRATATVEPPRLVTLWEASRDKNKDRPIVPLTAGALRKERERHPGEFPARVRERRPGVDEFNPDDLRRWYENKVRQRSPVVDVVVVGDDDMGNEADEVGRVDRSENESLAEKDSGPGWLQGPVRVRDRVRDRLRDQVAEPNGAGCKLWTGAVSGSGYGYMWVDGKSVPVHRVAYELEVGPIPDGLTIDHRIGPGLPCTSKLCTTGDHLKPVTNEKNVSLRWERQRAEQGAAST